MALALQLVRPFSAVIDRVNKVAALQFRHWHRSSLKARVPAAFNFFGYDGRSAYRSRRGVAMPVKQGRMMSIAMVLFALAAVGGSSASEGWLNSRGGLKPALPGLWIGGDDLLLYRDTLSNRQYALDTLALKYVGDYTDYAQVVEEIGRGYWCGTPAIEQMGKIPARERSKTALRKRARAMVERHVRTGR